MDGSALEITALLAVGFAAGVGGGLVGVGGGLLFVPGLVILLDESQVGAEATSLLAIIFVGALGAWRQHGYGNLRLRDGIVLGALSPAGVVVGTVLSNELPEEALKLAFAAVMLYWALRLGRRALWPPDAGGDESPPSRPDGAPGRTPAA
jgi:uncharacterized protein